MSFAEDRDLPHWIVVIPFKGAPDGKSRLSEFLGPEDRAALAQAFLEDVVEVALAVSCVSDVFVVTPGRPALPEAVQVVADPGNGLNAAVQEAVLSARESDEDAWIAVLTGDIPLVQVRDLEEALGAALEHDLGMVADNEGTGTTMLTSAPTANLEPRFGIGSRTAHLSHGFSEIGIPVDSALRFDIDTLADIESAEARGGFGEATYTVLNRMRRSD
jgi:2-phospho-L-lactate/phosphoenolpyruvate guanylyltransferase